MTRRPASSWPARTAFVDVRVVAHQGGVDQGHPPHGLADEREAVRPVRGPGPQQPVHRVPHRGDGPAERARLGRRIADVLAVPGHPAAGRAEPGVFTARLELLAALLATPCLRHHLSPTHVTRNTDISPVLPFPSQDSGSAATATGCGTSTADGYLKRREASINDLPIAEAGGRMSAITAGFLTGAAAPSRPRAPRSCPGCARCAVGRPGSAACSRLPPGTAARSR